MHLTIKDLQIYLGGVSERTAIRFKKKVLLEGKFDAKSSKKKEITAIDVARYHGISIIEVLTVIKNV